MKKIITLMGIYSLAGIVFMAVNGYSTAIFISTFFISIAILVYLLKRETPN